MTDMQKGWEPLLEEISKRRDIAYQGGGQKRIHREHSHGRNSARERIDLLADKGSFLEFGTLVSTPTEDGSLLASTFVCGLAEIDGRPVAIGVEDFTVEGGGTGVHLTRYKGGWGGFIEELALGYKLPLILLMQGVGGSLILQQELGYPQLQAGNAVYPCFQLLDTVPVLAAVLGPTAGSSAARAHMTHFSVMSEDNGCLFAGGPPLVKQALGQDIDKYELGGADVQARQSGLINNVATDELNALKQVRDVLTYLPDHVGLKTQPSREWSEPDAEKILHIVSPNPRRTHDAIALINCIVDIDSFFEVGVGFGKSVRIGFARIEGHVVGICSSDNKHLGGALDSPSSEKQTHFISVCDIFHIPVVYIADVPGFIIGRDAEASGTLKYGAKTLHAIQTAKIPIYTLQVKRSYGLGGIATGNGNPTSVRIAWPSASWGDLPMEGGVEAAYKKELDAVPAEDRKKLRDELTQQFESQTSIWRTVEKFGVEEMIDPRETRKYLSRLLKLAHRLPVDKE